MPLYAIDETNNVYGLLRVVRRAENSKTGGARWFCQCACGGTKTTTGNILRRGECISCGCERTGAHPSEHRNNKTGRATTMKRAKGNAAWQALGG